MRLAGQSNSKAHKVRHLQPFWAAAKRSSLAYRDGMKWSRGWYLFDTGREVCDDFKDVVGLGEVFADVGLICTYDSDGQARACVSQSDTTMLF